jgi:cytidylate kinase
LNGLGCCMWRTNDLVQNCWWVNHGLASDRSAAERFRERKEREKKGIRLQRREGARNNKNRYIDIYRIHCEDIFLSFHNDYLIIVRVTVFSGWHGVMRLFGSNKKQFSSKKAKRHVVVEAKNVSELR